MGFPRDEWLRKKGRGGSLRGNGALLEHRAASRRRRRRLTFGFNLLASQKGTKARRPPPGDDESPPRSSPACWSPRIVHPRPAPPRMKKKTGWLQPAGLSSRPAGLAGLALTVPAAGNGGPLPTPNHAPLFPERKARTSLYDFAGSNAAAPAEGGGGELPQGRQEGRQNARKCPCK